MFLCLKPYTRMMKDQQHPNGVISGPNLFKFVPVALLLLVWLIYGLSDPGGQFEHLAFLRWLSYPVIVGAVILWTIKFTRFPRIRFAGIECFLVGIFLITIVSCFLNNDSLTNWFYGVLIYLRYPVFFLLLISNIDSTEEYLPFIKTLIIVSFFIILEAFNNFFLFGYRGDHTFISLGHAWGHAVAGVWLMYAYLILFAYNILRKRRKTIWVSVLGIMVMGVFVVASIRTGLVYLPVLIFLSLAIYSNKIKTKLLPYISGILILSTLGFALYTHKVCNGILPLPQDVNPQFRLNYIAGVIEELHIRGQLLFGAGPRSMAPGSIGVGGEIYQFFVLYYPGLQHGGTNQYVKIIPELGLIGFALYWGLLCKLIKINIFIWDILKYKKDETLMNKTISLSYFSIWLHYAALGLFNNDLWRFDISSLIFWTLSSYVCTLYFKNNHACKSYIIRR